MKISKALELLREYLGELEHLRTLHYGNEKRWLWKNKVDVVLEAAFGKLSYEYYKLNPPFVISEDGFIEEARPTKYLENLKQYETGIKQILDKYKILGVETKPAAMAAPKDASESPLDIFDAMQFHPKVAEVSESLFKTGNYASAIFEAFKAVHNYVQDKTGLTLDGVNLMEKVFNENKPILQLNELLTKTDKDEQKGFKYLFMGSQMGIRNPPAHENVKPKEQNKALEYLGIASLLMRRIDESKLVKLNIKEQSS